MNKELIKKYKDVFDYWLDGGKVLYKVNGTNFADREWLYMTDNNPVWNINFTYVQDDQYAEFRKAQADGKVIQYNFYENNNEFPNKWNELNPNIGFIRSAIPRNYRIKPDEPKFKVGDWVLHPNDYIFKADKNFVRDYKKPSSNKDWELWQPKPDEWCWFWNAFTKDAPLLTRFIKMTPEGYYTSHSRKKEYSHCEPFVGTLPSSLKE